MLHLLSCSAENVTEVADMAWVKLYAREQVGKAEDILSEVGRDDLVAKFPADLGERRRYGSVGDALMIGG